MIFLCWCIGDIMILFILCQYLSTDFVTQDAKLFCYYIGLPSYDVFLELFNYLSPLAQNIQYVLIAGRTHFCHKPGRLRCLSLVQEMFATLVRLHLGLPTQDLDRSLGVAAVVSEYG